MYAAESHRFLGIMENIFPKNVKYAVWKNCIGIECRSTIRCLTSHNAVKTACYEQT